MYASINMRKMVTWDFKSLQSLLAFFQVQSPLSCYFSGLFTPTEEVNPPDPAAGSTNPISYCNSEVLPACPRASADPKHPPQHPQSKFAPTSCPQAESSTLHTTQAWELLVESSSMWESFPFDLCHPLTGIRSLQFFHSLKGWNKYWRRIEHYSLICCTYPLSPSRILEHSQHCLASGCIQQKALGAQ